MGAPEVMVAVNLNDIVHVVQAVLTIRKHVICTSAFNCLQCYSIIYLQSCWPIFNVPFGETNLIDVALFYHF